MDSLLAFLLDEGKWLPASMGLALLSTTVVFIRHRGLSTRSRITAAMNLFFGVTIATMAFGHLLAVTIKLVMGTLKGPAPGFYLIGIVLAVPSWLLIYHTRRLLAPNSHGRSTVVINAWLAITLIALGIHNLPLAAPAFVNIGYQLHSRPLMGWAIVSVAVVINAALFIASLIFLASGQSFEQFRGG